MSSLVAKTVSFFMYKPIHKKDVTSAPNNYSIRKLNHYYKMSEKLVLAIKIK